MKKLIILFGLVVSTGCSYYSFSGALPNYIKTAAVPLFENETVEAGLVEELTDAVEKAIVDNGSMKIANESQADAVVRGTIVDVIDEADQFTKDEKAQQFKIRIFAHVQFFDRVKNRVVWEEDRIEGWARYDAGSSSGSGDSVNRDQGIQLALDMLAKEIIDKTVAGW